MAAFFRRQTKLLSNKFGLSTWTWILLIESIGLSYWVVVQALFLIEDPQLNLHPPYAVYVQFLFLFESAVLHPIKIWLLATGISNNNDRKHFGYYAMINYIFFPPCCSLAAYMRWDLLVANLHRFKTVFELVVNFLVYIIIFWFVYRKVPKLLKRLELDMNAIKRLKEYVQKLKDKESSVNCGTCLSSDSFWKFITNSQLKHCFINALCINVDTKEKLGEGQFGSVYKGRLLRDHEIFNIVAKTNKEENLDEVVQEMKICLYVGDHENIVKFFGVSYSPATNAYYLITEFCSSGDLKSYLDKISPNFANISFPTNAQNSQNCREKNEYCLEIGDIYKITATVKLEQDLKKWAKQMCAGMAHLVSKKVIHGDLAARNILLSDDMQVKITDFGMSKHLYNYQLYVRKMCYELTPWRHISVEALEDLKLSETSDVWAYGVTLWELFTLGQVPYSGVKYTTSFSHYIRIGHYKLPKPAFCDDYMFAMMQSCWAIDPKDRPSFQDLLEFFNNGCKSFKLEKGEKKN